MNDDSEEEGVGVGETVLEDSDSDKVDDSSGSDDVDEVGEVVEMVLKDSD